MHYEPLFIEYIFQEGSIQAHDGGISQRKFAICSSDVFLIPATFTISLNYGWWNPPKKFLACISVATMILISALSYDSLHISSSHGGHIVPLLFRIILQQTSNATIMRSTTCRSSELEYWGEVLVQKVRWTSAGYLQLRRGCYRHTPGSSSSMSIGKLVKLSVMNILQCIIDSDAVKRQILLTLHFQIKIVWSKATDNGDMQRWLERPLVGDDANRNCQALREVASHIPGNRSIVSTQMLFPCTIRAA